MQPDPRVVILVGGPRYSGKDFVSNLIAMKTTWDRSSFAKAIKAECAQTHGLDFDRLMHDQQYKDDNREVLIAHGQAQRAKDRDYWARQLLENHRGIPLIVSDFRIPRECEFLRSQHALVVTVLVVASDSARSSRGWIPNPKVDNDVTEQVLKDWAWDVVIYNEDGRIPDVSELIDLVNSRRLLS